MRYELQNKINGAISRGIKIGLDLYDDEYISLDKDLLDILKLKEFKAFDPYKHITDKIVEDFVNGDTKYSRLFKNLCCNYCDAYYQVYTIRNDNKFIKLLIEKLCFEFGNTINLNWIDVSHVENMHDMFSWSKFIGDISHWDVSNVQDMSYMFQYSRFNGDISYWNTSNVCNMEAMFAFSEFNGDLSKWDVSNVKNMNFMFDHSQFNGDISKWDVSNVMNMKWMFQNSLFNRDISTWDVSHVCGMSYMFLGSQFNQDISNWNIKYSDLDTWKYVFKCSNINKENLPKKILKYYNT